MYLEVVNLALSVAGAEDAFLEFDLEWRGKQEISLSLNPAPKFLQVVPGIKQLSDLAFSWSVSP